MKNKRREFLKLTSLTSMAAGLDILNGFAWTDHYTKSNHSTFQKENSMATKNAENHISLIGAYGAWAASLVGNKLPALSFRRTEWTDVEQWKTAAKKRLEERMSIPDIGGMPAVHIKKQFEYDGLHIEELTWQLPYGQPTEGILLKPANAKKPLPGILAFHDHGGNKYFGTRKITLTSDTMHPLMEEHQKNYYEGMAWANEIAKRGYVVLVPDAFTFGSRRVMLEDVPDDLRGKLNDRDPENPGNIHAYNEWASNHEAVMAKSLFCAGTTWPGVFFAEDRKALDILCSRKDVNPQKIGCGGLSGGGLRTVFMAGLDSRIKCAIPVGFMSTWRDFLLNKCYNHTWMLYVPLLPNEMDFPEILALHAPSAALVLNDEDDDLYTKEGMRQANDILKEIYQKANAADRYKCSFYPGPHKFDKKMQEEAFAWFDKWLGF